MGKEVMLGKSDRGWLCFGIGITGSTGFCDCSCDEVSEMDWKTVRNLEAKEFSRVSL